MTYGGLVILGNTGTGKDPLANGLVNRFTGVKNVKFSEMTKVLLAQLFRVPRAYLEDKEWRTTKMTIGGVDTNVTPLKILNALYFGAQQSSLHQDNLRWVAREVAESFPVFTDIRRVSEFSAIRSLNPLVIRLVHPDRPPGETDGEQNALWNSLVADGVFTTMEFNLAETNLRNVGEAVIQVLQLTNVEKGVLHVYVGRFTSDYRQPVIITPPYPHYEPLAALVGELKVLLENYGVIPEALNRVVAQIAGEIDPNTVTVENFTGSRSLIFRNYHLPFVKALRRQLVLSVHVVDEEMQAFASVVFTDEEISR